MLFSGRKDPGLGGVSTMALLETVNVDLLTVATSLEALLED